MRKETSFLAVGLVLGALVTATCFVFIQRSAKTDGGAARVLKLGHALDQSHPVHAGMEFMAQRLAEISGGQMEIQIFPNGQLGSEPETVEQLQRGALAMVKTSAAAMEGFVPEMAVFGLPYLFRDDEHYWTVLNGPIGKELLEAGAPVGIHGLCYYDSGSRSFYTIDGPILDPEAVKGQKIRTLQSRMAMDLISTMDGAPTPIPWGELYTALQQRMVDGAENNPPSFLTSRHYEVAKYYSLDEHTRIPDMVIFSQKIWDTLSPQQQAWVEQAAMESVDFQRALWTEKTEEALEQVEAAGVTVYRPDKTPFVEATAPLYEQFKDTPIGRLAARIREVQ
ncbi:TRAP transporter substrate-binding protein [Actomonas aquatica]|uniref:TRAP transporter substrate-binding protein n=1 Tax=Actomonas aquatica TaxID=2866162 RepID=A0ABZ1C7K2_9BACT|nr:TRAP transporter substrate-binding protein [Opitutus sp. WL0086]WRQ87307.1 TRAP transporter substrate-binding protein [Opitutus sp. WL0086]